MSEHYTVTVKGFNRISVQKVKASCAKEAEDKVLAKVGFSIVALPDNPEGR